MSYTLVTEIDATKVDGPIPRVGEKVKLPDRVVKVTEVIHMVEPGSDVGFGTSGFKAEVRVTALRVGPA